MDAYELLNKAMNEGERAAIKHNPDPMIITSGEKQYKVEEGLCGFAWITFKANNPKTRKFINELKKKGFASSDINDFSKKVIIKKSSMGGYRWWCPLMTQGISRKKTYMESAVEVLKSEGINCHVQSRLD